MSSSSARNSNLELLRIICMLMIVFHHISMFGGIDLPDEPDLNVVVYAMQKFCGQFGVLIFFLISGYFMVNQKITVKKLLRLVLEIWFYSFVILAICIACGVSVPPERMIKSLFPIVTSQWWFMDAYLGLMIVSPFINMVLHRINERQHLLLCGVMFFLTYIQYSTIGTGRFVTAFGTAVTMYLIAGYIRLHPKPLTSSFGNGVALTVFSLAADIVLAYSLAFYCYDGPLEYSYLYFVVFVGLLLLFTILYLTTRRKIVLAAGIVVMLYVHAFWSLSLYGFGVGVEYFRERMSITELFFALGMFLTFLNMRPRHSKAINWVAASTLAVYLIHESILLKHLIWKPWLHMDEMFADEMFPLYAVACTLLVFAVCIIIDKLRIWLVFKPLDNRINSLADRIESKLKEKGVIGQEENQTENDRFRLGNRVFGPL
ncbi:MAG: acyltransferase [Thermoplasmata archaeon]|nr:acyltransferase [Thermoplasmata archaeon]